MRQLPSPALEAVLEIDGTAAERQLEGMLDVGPIVGMDRREPCSRAGSTPSAGSCPSTRTRCAAPCDDAKAAVAVALEREHVLGDRLQQTLERLLGCAQILAGVPELGGAGEAGERLRRSRRRHERLVDALVRGRAAVARLADEVADELAGGPQRHADHGRGAVLRADHELVREPVRLRAELLGAELALAILAAAPDDARLEPILRERDLHEVEAERIADAAGEQLDDRERLLGRGERADGAQQAQPCRGALIPARGETPERILDRAGGALDDGDARDLLDGAAALDADDALDVRRERRRGEPLDAAARPR